jgi:hypothetical protein
MNLKEAEKFVGKEVSYANLTGILQKVRQLTENTPEMILGYTDNGLVINIVLYRYKDENGNWVDIELPKKGV